MADEARPRRIVDPSLREILDSPLELAGPDADHGPGIDQRGDRSLEIDGVLDQLQRLLSLILVAKGEEPRQVVERLGIIRVAAKCSA